MEPNQDLDDDVRNILEDSDDSETVTSLQVLEMFKEHWINEKFAPEILPHKQDLVDCLLDQIKHLEANMENLDPNDFRGRIHKLEIERVRYMLCSYLRCRLEKIEQYTQIILKEEDERQKAGSELYLSPAELKFAKTFQTNQDYHFEKLYSFIPGFVPDVSKDVPVTPNKHNFVFFKAKREVDGVIVEQNQGSDDLLDIKPGMQLIMSYNSIKNLLTNGDIQLI